MTDFKNKNASLITILSIAFFIILIALLISNKRQDKQTEQDVEYLIEGQTEDGFEDGTYCAEVDYYNPNTTTRSEYELEVEVENNEIVKIYFGNGGWLDTDHFSPEVLDDNGTCIITSDRDYEYTIQLIEKDGNCQQDEIPEEEEPETLFSTQQCADIYGMTPSELSLCVKTLNISMNEKHTEEMCQIMGNYIQEVRKENQRWGKTQNEINNGYITNITRRSAYGNTIQIVTILKNGISYELEVRGNAECTMGTATFDENNYDWQLVYIKQNPNRDSYSGHYMRIIL